MVAVRRALGRAPLPGWGLGRLRHGAALAVFVALAAWVVAPCMADPTRWALGHPDNDVWNHLWGYYYVAEALGRGEAPLHTELLLWPQGGSLWFIDSFNALLTLPIQWWGGPVAAYNAAFFFNFILCGAGAYALAWRATRSWPGALFAGVAFETTPQLLGQAYNGISETLAAGWLPLALLGILELRRGPTRAKAVVAGALFGICAVANWYYGLFAGLFLLAVLGRGAIRAWRRRVWSAGAEGGLGWRSEARPMLRAAGVWGASALAVLVVPVGLFLSSMVAEDAVVSRTEGFVWSTLVLHNMTDVLALVTPGRFYSPDLKEMFGEGLIVVVYLGHTLLVPALLGLLWVRWRRTGLWAVGALAYLVLTLGPFLYVNGDYLQVAGGWVPLPFLALHEWAPAFGRLSHAYRFAIGAGLALGMLAALALAELQRRGWPTLQVAVMLCVARVLETFLFSPAVFPLPVSDAHMPQICHELTGGAVLDLPVGVPVLARSRYGLCQLAHGQPVPYAINEPVPDLLWSNRFTRLLIEAEWSTTGSLPAQLPLLDVALGQQELIDQGLRWVVLHEALYPPAQFARVATLMDVLGEAVYEGEGLRVYRVE